jgi:hypothetical protein
MAKDLKCPVNAHRHIVGDVRTFRLPAQTKKFFIHEPTDSRRNPRRGSRLWRRAFVLGRVCTLTRIDVQSCARSTSSAARLVGVAGPRMKLARRFAAEGAMRTNVIIVSTPSLALSPSFVEAQEPVGVQAL